MLFHGSSYLAGEMTRLTSAFARLRVILTLPRVACTAAEAHRVLLRPRRQLLAHRCKYSCTFEQLIT